MKFAFSICLALVSLILVRPASQAAADTDFDWPLQEHVRIFEGAFALAGLDALMAEGEAFTLFVPSDAALERDGTAGLLTEVYRTSNNRARLVELMGYHLVPGRKIDLEAVTSIAVSTHSGETLSIDRQGERVLLNRHVRVASSIDLGRGTIHMVDGLLWADLVYDRSGRDYQAYVGGQLIN